MLESTLSRVFISPDNGAFMPQEQGTICPDTAAPTAWHNCPTMEPTYLQVELKRRRHAAGMSQRQLSEAAGLNDSAVKKIESGGVTHPRMDTLSALAKALGCSVADLMGPMAEELTNLPQPLPTTVSPIREAHNFGPTEILADHVVSIPPVSLMPKDVPVLGVAVGGDDSDFEFNGQIVDYVRRPPGLAGVQGAFGVYVMGTSMEPRYEEGELVYVHPGRPARPGDDVIIEMFNGDEDGRSGNCYIKRLLKKAGGNYVCRQYNPARDDLVYPVDRVKKVHRIMTAADLMSA